MTVDFGFVVIVISIYLMFPRVTLFGWNWAITKKKQKTTPIKGEVVRYK